MNATKFFALFALWSSAIAWSQKTVQVGDQQVVSYTFEQIEPVLFPDDDVTYVINFWATWCAPCIKELPYFSALQAEKGSAKFQVVLVSLDFSSQIEKRVLPFLARNPTSAKVLHLGDPDANAWIDQVHPDWSGAIPATVVYNKAKGLRVLYEQAFTKEELQTEMQKYSQP